MLISVCAPFNAIIEVVSLLRCIIRSHTLKCCWLAAFQIGFTFAVAGRSTVKSIAFVVRPSVCSLQCSRWMKLLVHVYRLSFNSLSISLSFCVFLAARLTSKGICIVFVLYTTIGSRCSSIEPLCLSIVN